MGPDPEWDELISWVERQTPQPVLLAAPAVVAPQPITDDEQAEWEAVIARIKASTTPNPEPVDEISTMRARHEKAAAATSDEDALAWQAAIRRAKGI